MRLGKGDRSPKLLSEISPRFHKKKLLDSMFFCLFVKCVQILQKNFFSFLFHQIPLIVEWLHEFITLPDTLCLCTINDGKWTRNCWILKVWSLNHLAICPLWAVIQSPVIWLTRRCAVVFLFGMWTHNCWIFKVWSLNPSAICPFSVVIHL